MDIKTLDDLTALALKQNRPRSAAVVAAHERHIMEAIVKAKRDGLIRPLLIGRGKEIEAMLSEQGENLGDFGIFDCPDNDASVRQAIELVHKKQADFLIKGILETAQLMKQCLKKETGILSPGKVVSSVALLESGRYHKLFAMTDMGINMYPDLEKKIQIIENAVWLMHRVGNPEPKVAVLSAVEKVNPKMPDTVDADAIKKRALTGEMKECIVEGPISLDLAISAEAAAIKKYDSPVAGEADILMVPNIVAGNLLIKGMGFFGDIRNADVILGCDVPIVFGSRGGPAEGKYRSIALSALIAE